MLDNVTAKIGVDQPTYRVVNSGHKAGVANAVLPGNLREFPCFEDAHDELYSSKNYSLLNYTSREMLARNRRLKRSLVSPKHRLALVDEGLHRLFVVRGHGGADQAFGFVVARGGEIEQQGFVEIVLHVAQRNGRPFRH